MALVFVSYSHQDKDFVLRLVKDLRQRGVDVWFDQDIIPGEIPWDDQVQAALKLCTQFLIVLSPSSTASKIVKDELAFALNKGKPVVPLLHKECVSDDIPLRITRLQYIDFTADYELALAKLLDVVPISLPPIKGEQSELKPAIIESPQGAESNKIQKTIEHYMLFWHRGPDNWAQSDLQGAFAYVARFPETTIGFSLEEAKSAKYVTIIGGPGGVPVEAEKLLRAAGCQVERVVGATETETRHMLEQLAAQGKRFFTLS
ncbi:MAG: TIR domain-containing protein [Chloroflexota bacterium]